MAPLVAVQRPRAVMDVHRILKILFFFSSRRRHTRWTGDWSSDVCSSDLFVTVTGSEGVVSVEMHASAGATLTGRVVLEGAGAPNRGNVELSAVPADPDLRSEERRVGKGCRLRWVRDNEGMKREIRGVDSG